MANYTISIESFVQALKLEVVYAPSPLDELFLDTAEINRPGLIIAGYTEHFDPHRIQIIGLMEQSYLEQETPEERYESLKRIFSRRPCLVAVARDLEIFEDELRLAREYAVPLVRTSMKTSDFMSATIGHLNVELGQRVTWHGELIEVYGTGILIIGDSGIGKSETAVEMLKRGHRLVADDAVELRRVSEISIVGSAPENTRYFMELRGIGIVNVRQLFGMGAVKVSEKVDLIIKLEPWDSDKSYTNFGGGEETMDILGIKIPTITVPVKPGRNLAVILEVAAMNHRDRQMGYNAEQELLSSLGLTM
ncbi:MAG: HPr(Ser) kinase/phosphatase [Oscillospiraceae bacterium]|nr:HPr(Ser) kinase/phosphatase [Oscillospiraceae bacterium]